MGRARVTSFSVLGTAMCACVLVPAGWSAPSAGKLEFGRGETQGGGSWRLLAYRNDDELLCVDVRVKAPGDRNDARSSATACGPNLRPACGPIGMVSFSFQRTVSEGGDLGRGEVGVSGPVAQNVGSVQAHLTRKKLRLRSAGQLSWLSVEQAASLDTRPFGWYFASFYPAPGTPEVRAVAARPNGIRYQQAAVFSRSQFSCRPEG